MKTIFLIRHTEKVKDKENPIVSFDGPLTDNGVTQAEEVAEYMVQHKDIQAVFTSILKRSQQAGKIVSDKLDVPIFHSASFNEYYVRPDKENVESTTMGIARVMSKIYSISDLYDSIAIIAHSSINSTILHCLLNNDYQEAEDAFNEYGETIVLRYDWEKGDNKWRIIDKFTPKSSK